MLKGLVSGAKLIILLIWSLFSWGLYALIHLFGNLFIRNADLVTTDPESVEAISNALHHVRDFGLGITFTIWLVGAVIILIIGGITRALMP
jgi:hypothetical protein